MDQNILQADDPKRDIILTGIREGFHIVDVSQIVPAVPAEMDNYKSATCVKTRDIVEAQIREEIDNNRYVIAPRVPIVLSALGAVPKKDSSIKLRIIHDCSRPYGSALNDFAYNSHFKYSTIQDAVTAIKPR